MTSSNIVDLTGQKIDLSATWIGWATWWEASLDMGSGITTIYIQPVKAITKERVERGPVFRLSFPSVVDTGEELLEIIANGRNAPKGRPASVLAAGEYVSRIQGSKYEHLVGSLADLEGEHPTNAKGDPDRYWGDHIRIIFAKGFKLVSRDSEGRTYGVRKVIEHIIDEINQDYGRVLEVEEVRIMLKAYTAGMRLPQ